MEDYMEDHNVMLGRGDANYSQWDEGGKFLWGLSVYTGRAFDQFQPIQSINY